MNVQLTPEQLAYARGYFQCFLDEQMPDNRDTDYETWFQDGNVDFNLHFSDGWVVVDAYLVVNGETKTRVHLRILDEQAMQGEVSA